jgi:hypothetical protein
MVVLYAHRVHHRYGVEVENYLEVYLRTPNLPKEDVARALLARSNARKAAGERLITKAQQGAFFMSLVTSGAINLWDIDFQAVLGLDPSNREIQNHLRRDKVVSLPAQICYAERINLPSVDPL